MKKIAIIGGGTLSPIRNHLSLCAPAFGGTAKKLFELMSKKLFELMNNEPLLTSGYHIQLHLTKMADPKSDIVTNDDVSKLIDSLIEDESVKTIIMNAALCDFNADIEDRGFHGKRLKTSDGDVQLTLKPADKVLDKIRRARPDIFLVGFKTTTGATQDEQFLTALYMMKRSKCNLVLANDTVTRHNMIITPEEVRYEPVVTTDTQRNETLKELVEMILLRHDLTYTRTNFLEEESIPLSSAPSTFRDVLNFVIKNGGFIENNGNGFTPGHYCYKLSRGVFVSSQRKVNHNDVQTNGMTLVKVSNDKITAVGSRKPSVGARSQGMLLDKYPEYDCIIHVHCPLKDPNTMDIPVATQKPFQCGSLECGMNTVHNMKELTFTYNKSKAKIMAVMLDKHGPNILFKSSDPPDAIIRFIESTVELGTKIS